MEKMRNPTLSVNTFEELPVILIKEMTIEGTVNKTIILLALVFITSAWCWHQFYSTNDVMVVLSYLWIGVMVGFFVGFITIFKKEWAPITAPIYALLEGFAIGSISAFFETVFPNIVVQAVGLTFGTLFCLLLAYKSGLIKVTETFKLVVIAATGAICLVYFIDIILLFFGFSVPFIHETGLMGICFSILVVGIAALNLVLDFELIRDGVENGAPKYMEWYCAFALIVTLIWLYLEILELLAKTRGGE